MIQFLNCAVFKTFHLHHKTNIDIFKAVKPISAFIEGEGKGAMRSLSTAIVIKSKKNHCCSNSGTSDSKVTVRMGKGFLTLGMNSETKKLFEKLNLWEEDRRKPPEN